MALANQFEKRMAPEDEDGQMMASPADEEDGVAGGKGSSQDKKPQPTARKPKKERPSRRSSLAEQAGEGKLRTESEPMAEDEAQDAFTRVELAAMAMLYDDKTHGDMVKMLQAGAQQPAKTLASVAMTIFNEIDRQSGGKIPERVILPALVEGVLGAVVDMAEKTRALPVDEAVAGKAVQELVVMAAQQFDIDPAEVQEMVGSVLPEEQQQIVQQQQQFAEA